jgi:hypothetical protein
MRVFGAGLVLLGALAITAQANIDLEWRILSGSVCGGIEFEVGLYAVSDNDEDQSTAAMNVIVQWDPSVIEFLGISDDGPYDWLSSGFPDDSRIDKLNDTFTDGNALYEALAQLGEPAYATPDGLLVTVFRFEPLIGIDVTDLEMLPTYGRRSKTVVYDGETPGKVVTGTIDTESFGITQPGDMDCDGDVDFDDIDGLVDALVGQNVYEANWPGCNWWNADCDCNGKIEFEDIDAFVDRLTD